VLNNLKEHGYSGIDDSTKVHRFIDGIHYKPLESCKTQIFSTAAFRVDFDACVDLINNMIYSQGLSYSETSTQIAATTAAKSGTKNNQGNSSGGGKKVAFARGAKPGSTSHPRKSVQVEDRYYSSEEYAQLHPDQKLSLKLLREKKNSGGHPGNQSKKRGLPKGTQINDEWAKKIADSAAVAALKTQGAKKAKHPLLRGKSSDSDSDAE
jgi:hypothetical protein